MWAADTWWERSISETLQRFCRCSWGRARGWVRTLCDWLHSGYKAIYITSSNIWTSFYGFRHLSSLTKFSPGCLTLCHWIFLSDCAKLCHWVPPTSPGSELDPEFPTGPSSVVSFMLWWLQVWYRSPGFSCWKVLRHLSPRWAASRTVGCF